MKKRLNITQLKKRANFCRAEGMSVQEIRESYKGTGASERAIDLIILFAK